jgi:hypothetical protein
MSKQCVLLYVVVATLGAFISAPLHAVALRPGKTTDASVCDLGPNTARFLSSQVLVPASAASTDKVAAYVRLAGAFITGHCSNGQMLILHGSTDVESDSPALEEVANSSCVVADIRRSEGQTSDGPYTYGTFEFRCTIQKLDAFRAKLTELEAKDPLEGLKARLANAAQPGNPLPKGGAAPAAKSDCSKLTLGSIVQGGTCK